MAKRKTPLDITVEKNIVKPITARMAVRADAIVTTTAFAIESAAKMQAPVRTGFLRNSIQSRRVRPLVAEVRVGALYGAFVEFGTRYSAAHPFFKPAVNRGRAIFVARMRKIL